MTRLVAHTLRLIIQLHWGKGRHSPRPAGSILRGRHLRLKKREILAQWSVIFTSHSHMHHGVGHITTIVTVYVALPGRQHKRLTRAAQSLAPQLGLSNPLHIDLRRLGLYISAP